MTNRSLLPSLAALALSGCLLPDPPPPARLFAPVTPPAGARTTAGAAVRLRPVHSPLHLREAMTWRRNEVEFGTYDQRRWTEQPSTYVARALEDALGANGVAVVTRDDAPALSVDVLHFEETLAPVHAAVVEIDVALNADRVLLQRRFTAEEPLTTDDPLEAARAIGRALGRVAAEASRAVQMATVKPSNRRR